MPARAHPARSRAVTTGADACCGALLREVGGDAAADRMTPDRDQVLDGDVVPVKRARPQRRGERRADHPPHRLVERRRCRPGDGAALT